MGNKLIILISVIFFIVVSLAAFLVNNYNSDKEIDRGRIESGSEIRKKIEVYYFTNNSYPDSLKDIDVKEEDYIIYKKSDDGFELNVKLKDNSIYKYGNESK